MYLFSLTFWQALTVFMCMFSFTGLSQASGFRCILLDLPPDTNHPAFHWKADLALMPSVQGSVQCNAVSVGIGLGGGRQLNCWGIGSPNPAVMKMEGSYTVNGLLRQYGSQGWELSWWPRKEKGGQLPSMIAEAWDRPAVVALPGL